MSRSRGHAFCLMLTLLLPVCGCGVNRQLVEKEEPRSFWEPRIRQVARSTEPVEETRPTRVERPADLRVSYARWMIENGNVREARHQFEMVLQDEPEHLGALLGLAELDLKSSDMVAVEQRLAKASRIAPDSPEVAFAMGRLRAHQRRWEEAVEAFNQASLAAPAESTYRFHLAVALTHAGRADVALPHFIRTVGDAEAHYNVGRILHDEGRLMEAEEHFMLAVAKKPDLNAAHEWLNRTRLSLRDAAARNAQAVEHRQAPSSVRTVGYVTPQATSESPPL